MQNLDLTHVGEEIKRSICGEVSKKKSTLKKKRKG